VSKLAKFSEEKYGLKIAVPLIPSSHAEKTTEAAALFGAICSLVGCPVTGESIGDIIEKIAILISRDMEIVSRIRDDDDEASFIASVRQRITEHENIISTGNEKLSTIRSMQGEFESRTKVRESSAEYLNLQSTINDLEAELKGRESELKNLDNAEDTLLEELKHLRLELSESTRIESSEDFKIRLDEETNACIIELEQMNASLHELERRIDNEGSKLEDLSHQKNDKNFLENLLIKKFRLLCNQQAYVIEE